MFELLGNHPYTTGAVILVVYVVVVLFIARFAGFNRLDKG
jgi:Mn2+/Fe2+ NRAMP family transporter